jgi:threonine dehydratase
VSSPYRKRTGVSTPYLTRQIDVDRSYEQVAAAMGISVARVGQLEFNALDRMRRCFALIDEGMAVDAAVELCKGKSGRPRKVVA